MTEEPFLSNDLPDNDMCSIFNNEYTKVFFQQISSESSYFKDTCEDDLNDEEQTKRSIKEDLTEINKNNLTDQNEQKGFDYEAIKPRNYSVNNDKFSYYSVVNTSIEQSIQAIDSFEEEVSESSIEQSKIKKKNYKAGRLKKDDPIPIKSYHSKIRKDNIKNKIKIHLINHIFYFTNGIIKGQLCNRQNITFRLPPHNEKKNTKIDLNKQLLNEKIMNILVKYGVSKKYYGKEQSNEKNLQRLQKLIDRSPNFLILNDYLNKTVKDYYNTIYYTNNIQEIIEFYKINRAKNRKLKFLEEFKKELKMKYNDKLYDAKFEKECNLFIKDFEKSISKNNVKS